MNSNKVNLDGRRLRIGIVQSRFNEPIVAGMLNACVAELQNCGVDTNAIDHVSVPGALEIPVALQTMAHTQTYDALIAIGAVIRGDTYHFEVVSNESCRGVMDVTLETGVPIANGILTVDTDEQALARIATKGADCARAAIEMAHTISTITATAKEHA
ncbi:MAG: 6,7-dimethyl-8-ribityllumazine synthase [Usitatibacteraceae bacterium]